MQKIIDKLENTNSQYNIKNLSSEWKENQKYREILVKKCINLIIFRVSPRLHAVDERV